MQTIEDLLVDDRFVEWVLSNGQKHSTHWQAWIQQEEGRQAVAEEARALILSLQRPEVSVPTTESAWQQLEQQLELHPPVRRIRTWWRVAAAVVALVALAWLLWPAQHEYQTAYGELQQLTLPDGTAVDLRANSTLWWEGDWAADGIREVYLDGEAYFQVTPAAAHNGMAFVVRADPLQVQVLGTGFNVVNRPERTTVTLIEGKVEVQASDAEKNELRPNDHYIWQAASKQDEIQTITEPKLYTSWREQVWHFEQTPLREIAQQLEHDYGKTVVIEDAQLVEKELSGSAPAKNLESLIKGITTSLGIQAQIKSNQIIFTP
ncbi:MAG: FecR domain-containing protein [Bacteroidota bacterium]